jgi:nicotinamide-nucleotide amidase
VTLAVAESCTGGLIANLLTNIAGSSEYFILSAVTYADIAKQKILGVSPEILTEYGAVHEETAKAMAAGARVLSGATYAISTTGIAGPAGGSPEKPVGTVCIGLAGPAGVTSKRYHFLFGKRLLNKKIFTAQALNILRRELLT